MVILQVLVAMAFVAAGAMKLAQPREKLAANMGWVEDFTDQQVKGIGALEVLGGLGLLLPAVLSFLPQVLMPLAAAGLFLTMLGAIATHVKRKELPMAIPSIVLAILSAILVFGLF